MPEDQNHDHEGKSLLSDGDSTPNSVWIWLVIAVIVSVVMVLSDHGGLISSLLFLFGPIILIILAIGKAADWARSQHAFDKPGGDWQPKSNGTQQGSSPETRDPAGQDRRE